MDTPVNLAHVPNTVKTVRQFEFALPENDQPIVEGYGLHYRVRLTKVTVYVTTGDKFPEPSASVSATGYFVTKAGTKVGYNQEQGRITDPVVRALCEQAVALVAQLMA